MSELHDRDERHDHYCEQPELVPKCGKAAGQPVLAPSEQEHKVVAVQQVLDDDVPEPRHEYQWDRCRENNPKTNQPYNPRIVALKLEKWMQGGYLKILFTSYFSSEYISLSVVVVVVVCLLLIFLLLVFCFAGISYLEIFFGRYNQVHSCKQGELKEQV